MRAGALHFTLVVAAMLALPAAAVAQQPGPPVVPIPGDPLAGDVEEFTGHAAASSPVKTPRVPRHPFMAPNGRSNLHNDAYMTDVYRRLEGPLGRATSTGSALFARECGSVTFDTRGRIETICVGVDRPVLALLDPTTLGVRATLGLPPREVGGGDIFTNFSGGGYFYLDGRDRAVVPTTTRHVLVVGQTATPGFAVRRDYDLSRAVPAGDELISVLPDWDGRIWFASRQGRAGWISPDSGRIASRALGEQIGNSFAVDDAGGVYIVTDAALYRFEARGGEVRAVWRRPYENIGRRKPGQTQAGSGTTPTLMGRRYVAITDNADPMNVLILRRRRHARGKIVCREPVFEPGAGATDQSLIGTGRSVVVENNYGYTGPTSVTGDATTTPGLERVKLDRDGRGCRTVWHSDEVAPSVVPKLAAGSGLVFTYTKPPSANGAWYATAIDYRSGETVYRRLAGAGLGFNNNFAPVTIGPDDTAYVGVLGGITRFAD